MALVRDLSHALQVIDSVAECNDYIVELIELTVDMTNCLSSVLDWIVILSWFSVKWNFGFAVLSELIGDWLASWC